jgi:hypothetical protein
VKHELKANCYLRHVDDFVLFHHDRAHLYAWQSRIEPLLQERLGLQLADPRDRFFSWSRCPAFASERGRQLPRTP